MVLLNSMTFHDFPGRVVTLIIGHIREDTDQRHGWATAYGLKPHLAHFIKPPLVSKVSDFGALTLLVGCKEEHLVCKN